MATKCCLAGIDRDVSATFNAAFKAAGAQEPATNAGLDVRELRKISPDALVWDVDALDIDALEMLRRVRFVLPDRTIAVYTGCMKEALAVECHLAGANVSSRKIPMDGPSRGDCAMRYAAAAAPILGLATARSVRVLRALLNGRSYQE